MNQLPVISCAAYLDPCNKSIKNILNVFLLQYFNSMGMCKTFFTKIVEKFTMKSKNRENGLYGRSISARFASSYNKKNIYANRYYHTATSKGFLRGFLYLLRQWKGRVLKIIDIYVLTQNSVKSTFFAKIITYILVPGRVQNSSGLGLHFLQSSGLHFSAMFGFGFIGFHF